MNNNLNLQEEALIERRRKSLQSGAVCLHVVILEVLHYKPGGKIAPSRIAICLCFEASTNIIYRYIVILGVDLTLSGYGYHRKESHIHEIRHENENSDVRCANIYFAYYLCLE